MTISVDFDKVKVGTRFKTMQRLSDPNDIRITLCDVMLDCVVKSVDPEGIGCSFNVVNHYPNDYDHIVRISGGGDTYKYAEWTDVIY